jgi:ankyrin repeat protein
MNVEGGVCGCTFIVGASCEPAKFRGLEGHLLLTCPQDINARGAYHPAVSHAAVSNGDVDTTTLLLEHGGDMTVLTHKRLTPLHEASRRAHLDIVELLLDHADIDTHDEYGNTPLFWAAVDGENRRYTGVTAAMAHLWTSVTVVRPHQSWHH